MAQMYQKNKGYKDNQHNQIENIDHVNESSFSQVLINN
jgi:hypothetical protein